MKGNIVTQVKFIMQQSIAWKRLSLDKLKSSPRKARYFRGCVQHNTDDKDNKYSISISILRSWQHKESRRSCLKKLQQNAVLQISGTFLDEFPRYAVGTVLPEDIGLANVASIVQLTNLYTKIRRVTTNLPMMTDETTEELIHDHCLIAQIISDSKKSRLVPSWATIALLYHSEHWETETSWSSRLELLKKNINACRESLTPLKDDDELLRMTVISLEDCILSMPKKKLTPVVDTPGRAESMRQVWGVMSSGVNTKSLRAFCIHGSSSFRLMVYLATLISCYKLENHTNEPVYLRKVPDLDSIFNSPKLPVCPSYALDKHTGGMGGYKRFQTEGIWVPEHNRWHELVGKELSDESFNARYMYEDIHGIDSSKSSKVTSRIIKRALEKDKVVGVKRSIEECKEPTTDKVKTNTVKKGRNTVKKVRNIQPSINNVPVAQPITSTFKKYVYMKKDVVLKGPYGENDTIRFNMNMDMYNLVLEADIVRKVKPSVLKPTEVEVKGQRYISWTNVGDMSKLHTFQRTTKLASDVTVVTRGSVVKRVSEIEFTHLTDDIRDACVNHLYIRFILGIGDSHPGNILLGEDGRVYGVDMEERLKSRKLCTSSDNKITDLLFSRRVKHSEFWQSRTSSIVTLSREWVQEHWTKDCLYRYDQIHKFIPSI